MRRGCWFKRLFLTDFEDHNVFNVQFDEIDFQYKFLCSDIDVSDTLIGYDFIWKNKVDMLTGASCLQINNVCVSRHLLDS